MSDFVFYTLICFALVIYRPKWGMLLFVGTIALENINIAPTELGMIIRPYQFIGGLTVLAVFLKIIFQKTELRFPKLNLTDWAVLVFALAGFVSVFGANVRTVALKQAIIVASFVALYFLLRIFVKNIATMREVLIFFVGTSFVTIIYGIWQNIRFAHGMSSFEVMAGRPNATFTEADWLGIYISLLLAIVYSCLFYFNKKRDDINEDAQISNFQFPISKQITISKYSGFARSGEARQIIETALYAFLVVVYIMLILTVSRSAWVGALVTTFVFILIFFTQLRMESKKWQWRKTFHLKIRILSAIILSLVIVYIFHLTTFQLFNRVQSTGTGLQKITIACEDEGLSPQKGDLVPYEELAGLGCRHINLEEIDQEKAQGNFVTEVYRKDPNVNVRQVIWGKVWQELKNHAIFGIGWGNINSILGQDERGAGLNSSNIFLEIWLGAGIFGLLAFITMIVNIFIQGVQNFANENEQRKYLGLFAILGLVAIIIPNLFNAGIMLGTLWLFFGVVASIPKAKL